MPDQCMNYHQCWSLDRVLVNEQWTLRCHHCEEKQQYHLRKLCICSTIDVVAKATISLTKATNVKEH
jgi:hypothetical protein